MLGDLGIGLDAFARAAHAPAGERRSLRMRVGSPQVDAGVDEHGGFIRVAFDLPRSGYATSVLAEIMGDAPSLQENAGGASSE